VDLLLWRNAMDSSADGQNQAAASAPQSVGFLLSESFNAATRA
jgi:hypothetical protein